MLTVVRAVAVLWLLIGVCLEKTHLTSSLMGQPHVVGCEPCVGGRLLEVYDA